MAVPGTNGCADVLPLVDIYMFSSGVGRTAILEMNGLVGLPLRVVTCTFFSGLGRMAVPGINGPAPALYGQGI